MNQKDLQDADYDELSVSESEFNDEEQRQFAKYFKERRKIKEEAFKGKEETKDYDDNPYQAKDDEKHNVEAQMEQLQQKLNKQKSKMDKMEEGLKYKEYVSMMTEMERQFHELKYQETERQEREEITDGLKYSNEVFDQIQRQKDKFYTNRVKRT